MPPSLAAEIIAMPIEAPLASLRSMCFMPCADRPSVITDAIASAESIRVMFVL